MRALALLLALAAAACAGPPEAPPDELVRPDTASDWARTPVRVLT